MSATEVEAILQRCGHPMLAGSRYLPQLYLIGPALFPTYWLLLKIVLIWILVPVFVLIIGPIVFFASSGERLSLFGSLWGSFWITAVAAFCIITLLFAILERYQVNVHLFDNWNPSKLPRLRNTPRIPYSSSIVEIAFSVLAILWWTNLVQFPVAYGIERAGIQNWTWGSAWQDLYQRFALPFLSLLFAGVAIGCLNLARLYWTRLRRAMRAAVDLITSGILFYVLSAHWWEFTTISRRMSLENPAMPTIEVAANWTGIGVYIIMLIVAISCAVQGGYHLIRSVHFHPNGQT